MSTLYEIVVKNESPETQGFYFFQKPAIYSGGGNVFSNSIYHAQLRGKASGATLKFQLLQQYYAGVQERPQAVIVGQASGNTSVIQPISLAPEKPNSTEVQLDPLGLTKPAAGEGVQKGAFRIRTPRFTPGSTKLNIGSGVQLPDGSSQLSNFINAQPGMNCDCQPVVQFYVQTGEYISGTVINYSLSSTGAAYCDATDGTVKFTVVYKSDGGWEVNGVEMEGMSQVI